MMRKLLYSFLFFISPKILSKKSSISSLGLLCVGMFFVVSANQLLAQSGTVTSNNSGNWNVAATWVANDIGRTGTVTTNNTSNIVNGNGTSFLTELTVGSVIARSNGAAIGTVASITSNTVLTLTSNAVNSMTNRAYETTSGPPSPIDNVVIANNHIVNVNGGYTCAGINIGSVNGFTATLNFSSSLSQLTVNGAFTLGGSGTKYGKLDMTNGGTLITNSIGLGNTSSSNSFNSGSGTVQLKTNNTLPTNIFSTFNNLTVSSGTTTLGTALTINGNLSITGGGLTSGANNLTITGNFTNAGTFNPGTATVSLNGNNNNQSFNVSNFNNLTLAGSGTKYFTGTTTVAGALVINSGVKADLGTTTHTANTLTLNSSQVAPSSWGSSSSAAQNKNDTYFANSGIINVSSSTCTTFSSVTAITNVLFGSINNPTSPSSTAPYIYYSNVAAASVSKGQYYELTVRGYTNGNVNNYYTAFFDWNGDGDFADSGEGPYKIGTINNSTGADGKATSIYLQIPTSAASGSTKMRVMSRRTTDYNTDSCAISGSTGQIQDYNITILDACVGNAPGNTLSTASSVCPNAPFTLSLQNTMADGTSYVWQTSPNGNAPWTSATATPTTFFSSTFSTDQAANTNVGDISLYGSDTSITGGVLYLTTLNTGYTGGFVIQKTPGLNINTFSASFDYKIYGGSGADGISLSYASNIANNGGGGENGEGSGIVLQLDTYDNEGVQTGSRVRITYNGSSIFNSAINAPFNLRTSSTTSNNVVMSVNDKGYLTLTIAGTVVVSNLALPAAYLSSDKSNWKFKFSGRTGASNDYHVIDNVNIYYLDTANSKSTFTTTQTVKTYYRVAATCGGTTVYSAPVMVDVTSATISSMTYNACTGTAFTVTPENGTNGTIPDNTTYTWTAPSVSAVGLTGGAANTVASATITGTLTNATSTAQTATYTVTPITGGCTGVPFTLTVTVNPKPTANVGAAVAAICQGATSAAMGGSIGGGATGGTWSGGSGTWNNATSPSGATYTAGASESGNITLTLTATGVSCSPAIVTKTITVNPKPTVANAGADQYGNGAFTLAANVPTAGTGTWSIASGPSTALTQFSNVNAANATFTPLGAGVYTLNWTITTASCGSSTDDVVLSNCVGNLIQNGDFSNGTNNWSKATTKGTKVEVLKENVYFPNGNSENYTAELDVEASLGQTVSVIPNVPYTLSFIYARRPGSSPTVAVDVKIIDGSSTITRNYTTSDTTNSSVFQTIEFTPSTSSIWIEFYNSLETTTLGSIVDNIVLLPTSQVNPVATTTPKGKFKTVDACNGASVQLDVENVPASGVSYSWTTTSTGVTFSQTDIKNPKITVTGTGIKNATVVVTTAGGCSSVSSTTYVNVLALPVAGLVSNDADNTFCEGTSVTFTASGGTSYAFKVGSTTVQSGASDTYTTTALTNGQTVTVDVTNASGCTSTSAGITNTVTPNNTITLTSAAGTDSQTVCANTAITNITYSTNGATGVNFGILPAGISGIWAGNVATISGTPTVNSTNSYNYTITLTGGCGTITATGTINVDSLPVGGSIAGGTTVCSGTGDTVLTLSGNSGIVAHWESSLDNFATAGTVINNTSTTLTVSNLTATTSYRAVITNGVCASINSATATITVKPLPTTPTITKNNNVSCGGFGIITLTDLPANWTINQTGLTTGSRSFSGTDSSVPIQNLTIDTYSFTVKDNTTGCTSNAATVVITDESSITEWTDSGWSNGEPDGSKSVVIKSVAVDQPFKSNKPNVVACSLIIDVPTTGPDVEIPSNVTLRITNIVKSNGKLVFKSGSSLVQKDNVQNDGDIVYIRATDVRRFDLTYWSSPIKSTKPEGFRMQDLSPTTYFDKFLYWSSEYKWATNLYGTLPMEVGKGYSIRGPQEFDNVDGGTFEGKFIGVPNNGNIDVTGVAVDKYFFLGNPYPSPIDVEKLWDANPDVLGPLYFWIHALLPQKAPGDNTARYSSNDYIICTAAGSTDINGETAPKSFDGFIAAGQGFFAKPKTTVIHFNNDMREGATENTNFFKTAKSASIERNRIWLNIRNTEGAFKQILVGYIQGATNSVDFNYDAATLGANSFIDFYSINETKKLTIQGRALPFDDTDVVPLGYKSTIDSDFTIAIDHADGFFDKQEVYLEDKTTGKIINLRNENYTFSTLAGTFADRFVLRYTNKTLGTGDFENIEDSVLISVKNKVVSITSSKETIKDVNIFNVGAQLMYSKNKVNSSELQINNLHSSDQVLLVKVTLENGSTVSKKVVFSNLP